MIKIFGRILVKETGSGVPNLVVAAYDSEMEINHECFTEFSLKKVGKRIGSILTDSDGAFTFTFDDLHFSGTEERPDLLLIVFAPEDIKSPENPFPLPPEKRILYISRVPRTDAGAEEAYVIRLLQEQLKEFSIQTNNPSDKTGEMDSALLFNAIQRSWDFNDSLKKKLAPKLQEQYEKATRIRKDAKNKFEKLSSIPLSKREHRYLITDPANFHSIQKTAISDGLNSDGFKKLDQGKNSLTFNVTQDELKQLTGQKEKIAGEITLNPQLFADLLTSKMGGLDLIYKANNSAKFSEDILAKVRTSKTSEVP